MSDDRALVLSNAFDLVEAGKPEEARALLEPLINEGGEERDNPDAWWIYAHTLADPVEARDALQRLLELDPDYPGAEDQLGELWSQFPELKPAAVGIPEDIPLPPSGDEEPDFVQRIDGTPTHLPAIKPLSKAATTEIPVAKSESLEDRPRKRRLLPMLLIAGAIILVVAIVLALLSSSAPPSIETAEVAGRPTDTISADAAAVTNPVGTVDIVITEGPQISLTDLVLTLTVGPDRATVASTETSSMQTVLDLTLEPTAAGVMEGGGGENSIIQPTPEIIIAATPTQETAFLSEPTVEPSIGTPAEVTAAPGLLPTMSAVAIRVTPMAEPTVGMVITTPIIGEATNSVVLPVNEVLLQNLIAAAPELTLAGSATRLETTSLGSTAIINVCSGYGLQLRQDINRVMAGLALASVGIEGVDAVAAQFTDCATGAAIRVIGTPIEAAQQFAATNDQLPYNLSWFAL